jgi:hypothetical protein
VADNPDQTAKPKRRRGRGRPFTGHGDPRNGNGRPSKSAEESYRERIKVACPPEDFEEIVRKAVQEAKRGGLFGDRARTWLSKQLGTDAPARLEQKVEATTRVAFTDDVAKILADPVATTKLLDAVQGHVVRVPEATPAPHSGS